MVSMCITSIAREFLTMFYYSNNIDPIDNRVTFVECKVYESFVMSHIIVWMVHLLCRIYVEHVRL